jgi:hypothetical protein
MQHLILQMQPQQRALLYTALLCFKNQVEQNLGETILAKEPVALAEFYSYTQNETNALIQTLFAECFPEDLELLQHFVAQWKIKKATPETLPAMAIAG